MRHGKKINHLGRKTAHRKAMLSNMACSLIEHKRITTTLAKAKALRGYVEPLITKSKDDTTHSRRTVFSYLQNKEVVTELFRDVAPKIADRPGGYTRIIRTGFRLGDNAEMCMIELVDFNELYTSDKSKKTTRRSRRGGKVSGEATIPVSVASATDDSENTDVVVAETEVEVLEETPVSETPVVEETPVAEAESKDEEAQDSTSEDEEKKD